MIRLIRLIQAIKESMGPGVLYMVSKTLNYVTCNKCGHVALSKRAINVLDLILMVVISMLVKIFLMPNMPEFIPQLLFWAIPVIWLLILGTTAPQRCRVCMSTDLRIMTEDDYNEYKNVFLEEEERINEEVRNIIENESKKDT